MLVVVFMRCCYEGRWASSDGVDVSIRGREDVGGNAHHLNAGVVRRRGDSGSHCSVRRRAGWYGQNGHRHGQAKDGTDLQSVHVGELLHVWKSS